MPRPVALAAALVLLAVLAPGTAQAAETYPGLDLDAALSALERAPIHRVPAAQARLDEAPLRPLLDPDTRVLVVPYTPLELSASERYDLVDGPLADWAYDRDLEVVLVVGTQVRIVGEASVGASSLDDLRRNLAHLDVTAEVRFALTYLRTGQEIDLGGPSGTVEDPAERDAVLAGCGRAGSSRRRRAPSRATRWSTARGSTSCCPAAGCGSWPCRRWMSARRTGTCSRR